MKPVDHSSTNNPGAPAVQMKDAGTVDGGTAGSSRGMRRRGAAVSTEALAADYNASMRQRLPAIVVGALIAVVAGISILWFVVAASIRSEYQRWVEARRADGLTVAQESFDIQGFPSIWRVVLRRPNVVGRGPVAWRWQGETIEVAYIPWSHEGVRLRVPGEQRLTIWGGERMETIRLRPERSEGSMVLDSAGRPTRLDLFLGAVEVVHEADDLTFRIVRVHSAVTLNRTPDADYRTPTFGLKLQFDFVALPPSLAGYLGPAIAEAGIDLTFKGRLQSGPLAAAVDAWRDSGGTIEIERFVLRWGAFNGDGSGTFALDDLNRPLAAFTARLRGYNEVLDVLVREGQVTPRNAAGAKVALNLLGRMSRSGEESVATVPLTAQDGRLFAAGVPLLRLDPLKLD
jgi:hypothetical protein